MFENINGLCGKTTITWEFIAESLPLANNQEALALLANTLQEEQTNFCDIQCEGGDRCHRECKSTAEIGHAVIRQTLFRLSSKVFPQNRILINSN